MIPDFEEPRKERKQIARFEAAGLSARKTAVDSKLRVTIG